MYYEVIHTLWFGSILKPCAYLDTTTVKENLYYYLRFVFASRRKNILGRKLGIEIGENSFDKGLIIYHTFGTVVNSESVVGKNCKLHGNNCIGNSGLDTKCPVLGDNIHVGVGAKIIGDVTLADNITVAAGAVVVTSFLEPGITVGGTSQKNQIEKGLRGKCA